MGLFRAFIILLLGSVFLLITFLLIGISSNPSVFQAIVNSKTRLPKNTGDVQQLPKIERVTFPTEVRHKENYSSIYHQYDTTVYLRIIVITYNRPRSLQKCLNSLSKLVTEGYSVALEIWIDRSVNGDIDNETLKVASSYQWDQGPVTVWVHGKNVGIMGQWINTWRPVMKNGTESSELALYVEDDVDISPYALTFIRHLHTFYASYKNVNSYSLQDGTKIMRSSKTKKPKGDTVYMHTLPGTWGMVLRPGKWIEFQNWFQEKRQILGFRPYVKRAVDHTERYKGLEREGKENTWWSMWFLCFMEEKNLLAIFSNLKTFIGKPNSSLSSNRREPGLHFGKLSSKKTKLIPQPLQHWERDYVNFPRSPVVFDHTGKVVKQKQKKKGGST